MGLRKDMQTVWVMTVAFTKRYFRSKVALFFTFLFPLLFLFIFGSIFGGNNGPNFNIVLINKAQSEYSRQFVSDFEKSDVFTVVADTTFEKAERLIGRGEVDAIVVLPEGFGVRGEKDCFPSGTLELYYDKGDTQLAAALQGMLSGYLEGINKQLITIVEPFSLDAKPIQTANLSQFDYTVAGLIGFSLLSLGIFSMSEGFTGDKKMGALRRMRVAPIRPWQLILATAINRVLIGVLTVAVMFIVAVIAFDFSMRGDYISLVVFTVIGTVCLFGFGMAIAGWAKDSNQAAPLTQTVTIPMMFLSGVFFPTFLMPDVLQSIVRFIPLTAIVDGLRKILTEGQTLFDLGPELAIIGVWTILIYFIAFKVFRWE